MAKIVSDSSCDLPEQSLNEIDIIPMTLVVNGRDYKDGEELSREEFFQILQGAKIPPGSASPSPADFLKGFFDDSDKVFVFTVSSALSSSYNNALLAKDLYLQEFAERMVHVFDSLNASIGQGLAILKLQELLRENLPYQHLIESMEEYIDSLKTFFVLEKMDNLINSGRVNKLMGKLVSVLNIKLIMGKTKEGKIELFDRVRGSQRAFKRLLNIIGKTETDFEERILGIAHYNCLEKAKRFQEAVERKYNFKDIVITQMGPTIATYADEGALLISF